MDRVFNSGERMNEFRIETFTALNATNYMTPTTNIGSNANFGAFSGGSSVFTSRQVQFALLLAF